MGDQLMTIRLNGSDLTVTQVMAAARPGEAVALAPEAVGARRRARAVVEDILAGDEPVHGLTRCCRVRRGGRARSGGVRRQPPLPAPGHRARPGWPAVECCRPRRCGPARPGKGLVCSRTGPTG